MKKKIFGILPKMIIFILLIFNKTCYCSYKENLIDKEPNNKERGRKQTVTELVNQFNKKNSETNNNPVNNPTENNNLNNTPTNNNNLNKIHDVQIIREYEPDYQVEKEFRRTDGHLKNLSSTTPDGKYEKYDLPLVPITMEQTSTVQDLINSLLSTENEDKGDDIKEHIENKVKAVLKWLNKSPKEWCLEYLNCKKSENQQMTDEEKRKDAMITQQKAIARYFDDQIAKITPSTNVVVTRDFEQLWKDLHCNVLLEIISALYHVDIVYFDKAGKYERTLKKPEDTYFKDLQNPLKNEARFYVQQDGNVYRPVVKMDVIEEEFWELFKYDPKTTANGSININSYLDLDDKIRNSKTWNSDELKGTEYRQINKHYKEDVVREDIKLLLNKLQTRLTEYDYSEDYFERDVKIRKKIQEINDDVHEVLKFENYTTTEERNNLTEKQREKLLKKKQKMEDNVKLHDLNYLGCFYKLDQKEYNGGHTTASCQKKCKEEKEGKIDDGKEIKYFSLTNGHCECHEDKKTIIGNQSLNNKICGDICKGEEIMKPDRFCGHSTTPNKSCLKKRCKKGPALNPAKFALYEMNINAPQADKDKWSFIRKDPEDRNETNVIRLSKVQQYGFIKCYNLFITEKMKKAGHKTQPLWDVTSDAFWKIYRNCRIMTGTNVTYQIHPIELMNFHIEYNYGIRNDIVAVMEKGKFNWKGRITMSVINTIFFLIPFCVSTENTTNNVAYLMNANILAMLYFLMTFAVDLFEAFFPLSPYTKTDIKLQLPQRSSRFKCSKCFKSFVDIFKKCFKWTGGIIPSFITTIFKVVFFVPFYTVKTIGKGLWEQKKLPMPGKAFHWFEHKVKELLKGKGLAIKFIVLIFLVGLSAILGNFMHDHGFQDAFYEVQSLWKIVHGLILNTKASIYVFFGTCIGLGIPNMFDDFWGAISGLFFKKVPAAFFGFYTGIVLKSVKTWLFAALDKICNKVECLRKVRDWFFSDLFSKRGLFWATTGAILVGGSIYGIGSGITLKTKDPAFQKDCKDIGGFTTAAMATFFNAGYVNRHLQLEENKNIVKFGKNNRYLVHKLGHDTLLGVSMLIYLIASNYQVRDRGYWSLGETSGLVVGMYLTMMIISAILRNVGRMIL